MSRDSRGWQLSDEEVEVMAAELAGVLERHVDDRRA